MPGAPVGLTYRTFAPPPGTADVIERLWVVRSPVLPEPRREVLVPDGRPQVVVPLEAPGVRLGIDGRRRPNDGLLSGLAVEPVVLEEVGPTWYVGARLVATGAARLTGDDTLVDDVRPIAHVLGRDQHGVRDLLRSAAEEPGVPDDDARTGRHAGEAGAGADLAAATVLAELLADHARTVGPVVPVDRAAVLSRAVGVIEAVQGRVTVEAVARAVAVHPSTLRRWFERYVGVGPKTFGAIVRFHAFVGELLAADPGSTSVLAALQGYSDASHAARDVRRYSGLSPSDLRRRQNGIARLMHGLDVAAPADARTGDRRADRRDSSASGRRWSP